MANKYELIAEFEDGKTVTVVADQRDFARYEVQPFADGSIKNHLTVRFIAWSAMDRQGTLPKKNMGWEKFSAECIEVRDVSEEDADPKA